MEAMAPTYERVMRDMGKGRKYATQLHNLLLRVPESPEPDASRLQAIRHVDKILRAMCRTIETATAALADEEAFEMQIEVTSRTRTQQSSAVTKNNNNKRASMEDCNGGCGSLWSYREEIESDFSSSSGTIASGLSSGDASSGSRFSTFSLEAAMHFDSWGIHAASNVDDWEEAEEEEMGEEPITSLKILVQEFFSAPTVKYISKRGEMSIMDRWFMELGVGWILYRGDGASTEEEFVRDARTWIRALDQILHTICFMRPLFPDRANLPTIFEEEAEHVGGPCIPDRYQLALFIQETMLKFLTFLDTEEFLSMDRVMLPPYTYSKLLNLLGVHDALSKAAKRIPGLFDSPNSVEVQRIENGMTILVSEYESKVAEAIRCTMEKIRAMSIEDGDDLSSSLNPQQSSDIHKATRSVMAYIRFLWFKYSSVDAAIRGKYVPHIEDIPPLDNMIIEMVSCLRKKLANISESFSDQGLGVIFLLNNSYFIQQSRYCHFSQRSWLPVDLNDQIMGYMERYLQVSWAPLLSCLSKPKRLCRGKNYSLLSKFESEFQKIYNTQMEWKVPDPGLRRKLRQAIRDRIIPGYTEYIEDNKVTRPKFSPQELEEILQELFEG